MTKKITISIPDDVAQRLEDGEIVNVSAYITEAVRARIRVEQLREFLTGEGFAITDDGLARRRRQVAEQDGRISVAELGAAWDDAIADVLGRGAASAGEAR